jgi:hypothetical protein
MSAKSRKEVLEQARGRYCQRGREGRKRRIYDAPATPFERLKACGAAGNGQIVALENLYRTLDPFALKEVIEIKLRAVLRYQIRTRLFKAA